MAHQLRPGYDGGEQIADDPIVWVVDDFLRADECAHVIEIGARELDIARVSRLGENAPSEERTGRVGWLAHGRTPTVRRIVERVASLVDLPVDHAESLQVVHYAEAQEYRPHFDAWDITTPKGREKTGHGGNRLVTALMYLNRVEAGGATAFPELGLEIAAVPGRLCLFHDLVAGTTARHRRALHAGLPVDAGEKWACNLWFRERRYRSEAGG